MASTLAQKSTSRASLPSVLIRWPKSRTPCQLLVMGIRELNGLCLLRARVPRIMLLLGSKRCKAWISRLSKTCFLSGAWRSSISSHVDHVKLLSHLPINAARNAVSFHNHLIHEVFLHLKIGNAEAKTCCLISAADLFFCLPASYAIGTSCDLSLARK